MLIPTIAMPNFRPLLMPMRYEIRGSTKTHKPNKKTITKSIYCSRIFGMMRWMISSCIRYKNWWMIEEKENRYPLKQRDPRANKVTRWAPLPNVHGGTANWFRTITFLFRRFACLFSIFLLEKRVAINMFCCVVHGPPRVTHCNIWVVLFLEGCVFQKRSKLSLWSNNN